MTSRDTKIAKRRAAMAEITKLAASGQIDGATFVNIRTLAQEGRDMDPVAERYSDAAYLLFYTVMLCVGFVLTSGVAVYVRCKYGLNDDNHLVSYALTGLAGLAMLCGCGAWWTFKSADALKKAEIDIVSLT